MWTSAITFSMNVMPGIETESGKKRLVSRPLVAAAPPSSRGGTEKDEEEEETGNCPGRRAGVLGKLFLPAGKGSTSRAGTSGAELA